MPQGLYAASSYSVYTTTSAVLSVPLAAPAAPMPAAPPPTTTIFTVATSSQAIGMDDRCTSVYYNEYLFLCLSRRGDTKIFELAPTGSPVDRIVGSIGPRLRELRLQQSLSLQELAERA